MGQDNKLQFAQELLVAIGNNVEPAEIAGLASEDPALKSATDNGDLPTVGLKTGRAVADFTFESRAPEVVRITFEVRDILAGDDRAVILGSQESEIQQTEERLIRSLGSSLPFSKTKYALLVARRPLRRIAGCSVVILL